MNCPPLDAAADARENIGFYGYLKWKKVMTTFSIDS